MILTLLVFTTSRAAEVSSTPANSAAASSGPSAPAVQWAFQPVRVVDPPAVQPAQWVANPIDAFVLAKMQEKGLEPSPPAGKRELLRRVTFDLIGLPPTPEEVEAFVADESATAYEKVVDRLLASPRYGERWGRHWLDVVRFGESHGYEQNHLRPTSWPYRDYVIRAFNDDKPYDRFVTEQLAGDAVASDDPLAPAATGFLVAGVHDTVGIATVEGSRQQRANDLEDIVSTTGAAFLGLTVGCARCHDHKFDPIPQRDFYRMAAVFAGVRHGERPLPGLLSPEQSRDAGQTAAKTNAVAEQLKGIDAEAKAVADRAVAGAAPPGADRKLRPAVSAGRNVEVFAPVAGKFVLFTILSTIDGSEPCLDEMEVFAAGGGENLALASAGAKATASSLLPGYDIHQIAHLNDGKYGNGASWISNERGAGWAQIELAKVAEIGRVVWSRDNSEQPRFRDRVPLKYRVEISTDGAAWKMVASGEDRLASAGPSEDPSRFLTAEMRERRQTLTKELEALRARSAALATPRAYIGQLSTPDEIHLLKRGDVMQPGEVMSPGALSKVPGVSPELETDGAAGTVDEPRRRLGLARWICRADNPLTARVMVNRIWQHHFGRGIVSTPSDFGANGGVPSHPELLDWLARDFVNGGWRIKRLHRLIVLSSTYRQASRIEPRHQAKDAGNVYLARMPLRRLEAEAIRDSILATSGKLDLTMGGPGFQLFKYRIVNVAIYEPLEDQGPATWRRAVYQQTARSIHDELMGSFDEPESAQRAPRREVTTTPLQALTLLNSHFVAGQAEFFAGRVKAQAGNDPGAQADYAFRLAFGRSPEPAERETAVEIIQRRGLGLLCRGLLNANEFLEY
ncbi:MAG: hypothetical protein JWP03_2378 [Phycisphaerales bacterium]|nr:hypothetical protein [Phycisphaerales bacterium]